MEDTIQSDVVEQPTIQEIPMPQGVIISFVENGWVVQVGCKKFVFVDLERMLKNLKAYCLKPAECVVLWEKHKKLAD